MAIEIQTDIAAYELPTYTPKVAKLFEAPSKATEQEAKWQAQFSAVVATIGKDNTTAELGATSYTECDLIALENLFNTIYSAYRMPLVDSRVAEVQQVLAGIDIAQFERLAAAVETLTKAQQPRAGFKATK